MKKILLIIAVTMYSLCSYSQETDRPLYRVDWKNVAKVSAENPDSIRGIIRRLTTEKLDTTLTWQERALAYTGQTYLDGFIESEKLVDAAKDSLASNNYEASIRLAGESLKKNPLSLKANYLMIELIYTSINEPLKGNKFVQADLDYRIRVTNRILNTIAATGDGSHELPFAVVTVSDEYIFLDLYLEISISSQSLLLGAPPCDKFKIKEKSKYYDADDIYFDITRVLELERQLFKIQ